MTFRVVAIVLGQRVTLATFSEDGEGRTSFPREEALRLAQEANEKCGSETWAIEEEA